MRPVGGRERSGRKRLEAPAGVLSAACLDQEPFFVHGGGALCVGCHAAPGGRARGLGTSSPCFTTTTFSLISTTSRRAGFIHLLLRSCIRSDLCISAPPCVRQRPPRPCARPAHPPLPSPRCAPNPPTRGRSRLISTPRLQRSFFHGSTTLAALFWGVGPLGPFPSIVPSCLQHAHSVYN